MLLLGAIETRSATTGLCGLFNNLGVSGTGTRCPGWAEIGEFGFQTFDIEPQRGTARECQHDHARGCLGLGKFDGQKIKNSVFAGRVYLPTLACHDPLEAQGSPPAAIFAAGCIGSLANLSTFPVE